MRILSFILLSLNLLPLSGQNITYTLSRPGPVSLAIYNPQGVLVRTVYSGQQQAAGTRKFFWNGTDDDGKPVPNAKDCTWKLLQLPAPLRAEYLMTLLVTLPPGEEWWETGVGNHTGVRAVAVDASGIYLGAGVAENVANAMKMSQNGTKRIWSAWQPDPFKGRWAYGLSAGKLYHLQQDGYIGYHPVNAPNGLYQSVGVGNNQTGSRWDALFPGTDRGQLGDWTKVTDQTMDMAAHNGAMVISYRQQNAIQFRHPDKGTLLRQVKITAPLGVVLDNGGNALVISGSSVLKVTPAGTVTTLITGLTSPWRLDVDRKNGDIYLAESAPSHQVKRFDAAGKLILKMGRASGRPYGPYQPADFMDITDITTTGDGFLVAEEAAPRRVARFSAAGKLVQEWHTGTQWVPSAAPDPDDPSVVYARSDSYDLLKLKLDYKKGSYRIERVYKAAGLASDMVGPRFCCKDEGLGGGFGDWVVRKRNGNTYLARRDMMEVLQVDDKANALKPLAVAKIDKPDGDSYLWTDRNGDGEPQPAEIQKYKWGEYGNYGTATAGGKDDLQYYRYNQYTNQVLRTEVKEFNDAGAPVYKSLTSPAVAVPKFTGFDKEKVYLAKSTGAIAKSEDRFFVTINTQPKNADWNVNDYSQMHIFDEKGNYVARVGRHLKRPNGPSQHAPVPDPGNVYCFKNLAGVVYNVAVATDFDGGFSGKIPAITYAWDKYGLYVGGLFDNPDTKVAPVHQYYHSGDNGSGTILPESSTGEALYFAGRENEVGVYRVNGWKGWVRMEGKLK